MGADELPPTTERRLKTSGIIAVTAMVALILTCVLYAATIRWLDSGPVVVQGDSAEVAALRAELERADRDQDSQTVILGLAVGILGIAVTGVVAINVFGFIAMSRVSERERRTWKDETTNLVTSGLNPVLVSIETSEAKMREAQRSITFLSERQGDIGIRLNGVERELREHYVNLLRAEASELWRRNELEGSLFAWKSALANAMRHESADELGYRIVIDIQSLTKHRIGMIWDRPLARRTLLDLVAVIQTSTLAEYPESQKLLQEIAIWREDPSAPDTPDTEPIQTD